MVDALQKAGGDARLTIIPDADHYLWAQVYSDPQFYAWLLKNSRAP